jgi:hypothetical protein
MLGPWLEAGGRLDLDLAREQVLAVRARRRESAHITPDFEAELLRILHTAERELMP